VVAETRRVVAAQMRVHQGRELTAAFEQQIQEIIRVGVVGPHQTSPMSNGSPGVLYLL
jgi:hypothetical protein